MRSIVINVIDNGDNPELDEEAVGKGALLLRLCVDSIAGVGGIVWIAEGPMRDRGTYQLLRQQLSPDFNKSTFCG